SLLHLCVRLGFMKVSEFVLCQPGALMMVHSQNQDGDTPLKLAQQTNQHALINLLKHPPNPLVTPLGGVSQVWLSKSHLLRFSHASGLLCLSVCVPEISRTTQTIQWSISLLRECVGDSALMKKIKSLRVESDRRDALSSYSGSPYSLLHNVRLNNMSQDEDEELLSSDDDLTTHTDSTTSSLNDSCVTITNSKTQNQSTYPQDSFDCESDSTASDPNSPIPDSFSLDEEANSAEIQCLWNIKSEKENFSLVSKTESEKDKVSRTLSFLRSRMVNTKIKHTGLMKDSSSSPSLFMVSESTAEPQRKRSNSESWGHNVTLRKTKSLIGQSFGNTGSSRLSFDYSAESWSVVVDIDFCRMLDKELVKSQEIIYELMQTEFHHVQTLSVMADILRRGLLEEVQLEQDVICQMFPRLDELLILHRNFLTDMETRQRESIHPRGHRNYIILQIGDILCQQFTGARGSQMITLYGDFCSQHPEALKMYKQQLQSNRKLQLFLRQQTALEGLRGVLEEVERRVGEFERSKKLLDIISRLDNKSYTRLKNGEIFGKQDLQKPHRTLTQSSALTCRTTSGRLKDVLALLLADILVFLQEKEQKFVFAALEQKPSVMPLQRLIVREIANQERGLFLISSDCEVGPEMYEIHTQTREERNMWMTLLRQATESLPDAKPKKIEGELKVKKIQKLQEALFSLDLQLCSIIEEKLKICRGSAQWSLSTCRLLVQPHPDISPQGFTLISDAQEEVVKLAITLLSWRFPCMMSSNTTDRFAQDGVNNNEQVLPSRSRRSGVVGMGIGPLSMAPLAPAHTVHLKIAEGIYNLLHILYSLQAAVMIQDSCFEVQNLLLLEGESLPAGFGRDFEMKRQLSFEYNTAGASVITEKKELEQRERDHAELLDKLMKEKEQFEKELRLFEEKTRWVKEEEKKVKEERERLREEGKKVSKERKSLETQIRLVQINSNVRQSILPCLSTQEK
ncbi:hypothetical protein DNTS_009602, partial [Danionella cerebrum]